MNTLYTITINRRKYVTTDKNEALRFKHYWIHPLVFTLILSNKTDETIPNVIAV